MTEPGEVDAVVLAGEPDSVHQLEGGDDDLPVAPDEQDQPQVHDQPQDRRSAQERDADAREWGGLDRIVDASPTVLGE